jgi:ATP-binding cassette subfamily B multidrug efflux pump
MSVSGNAFSVGLLKRIISFTKPYKAQLLAAIGLTIFLALISPIRPLLVQYTLDHFIIIPDAKMLLTMTMLMIGVLLIETIGNFFSNYIINLLGQSVIKDLRITLFKHINNFKISYFDQHPIGMLVTRVVSDMETIASIFTEGVVIVFGDLLQLSIVLIVMFYTDWQLALISISTIPLLLVATRVFKNGIKASFQDVRTQVARLNTFVQEHVSGISIIQLFNREAEEAAAFRKINKEHADAHIRSVWHYSVFLPIVEILSAVSIGLIIWLGARGVIAGNFSIGNIVAFTLFINMLFRPIRTLADRFNTLQMGMVSSERVFQVLDTEATIQNSINATPIAIHGEIEFKNVWMAYKNEDWVLKDLNFKIKKGQTVAIVGATGSGKTTIINLINRFYEFNKGEILIDGISVKEYDVDQLRKNIAVVLQDVFLFSDTIANNVTLNDNSITIDQVKAAAAAIGANNFIEQLPGGFNYNVMERGAMLSAGQRQLIAFIRAYLYQPSILVLDEATSSIDTETELAIQKAILTITQNRTSIIIAHRLSTIQNADLILVLDKGQLMESGNHQQLLQNKEGIYRKLYEMQFQE